MTSGNACRFLLRVQGPGQRSDHHRRLAALLLRQWRADRRPSDHGARAAPRGRTQGPHSHGFDVQEPDARDDSGTVRDAQVPGADVGQRLLRRLDQVGSPSDACPRKRERGQRSCGQVTKSSLIRNAADEPRNVPAAWARPVRPRVRSNSVVRPSAVVDVFTYSTPKMTLAKRNDPIPGIPL